MFRLIVRWFTPPNYISLPWRSFVLGVVSVRGSQTPDLLKRGGVSISLLLPVQPFSKCTIDLYRGAPPDACDNLLENNIPTP